MNDKKIEEKITKKEIEIIKSYNKGIKVILDLFNLNNTLKKDINESIKLNLDNNNFIKGNCYLIREDYFSNFLKFYSYDEIYQNIKNYQKNNMEQLSEMFLDLINNYENNFFDKINNYENPDLNDENLLNIEYGINNIKTELIFNYQYIIINQNIFEYIFGNKLNNNSCVLSYIINNKKIIIKYEKRKSIIIGQMKEDDNINIFFPKIILEYSDINYMNNQFNIFEKNEFDLFEKELNIKEKINDLKENENNIIGKIYLIDENKYNNLGCFYKSMLTNIYNNYENINKRIKNPYDKEIQKEKYYIINNKYINKLKEIFRSDEVNENNIEELNFFKYDINIIRKELANEELLSVNKAELKISENNILNYFTDINLISNEFKEFLSINDLFDINQEMIEADCLIGYDKIIIYSFSPYKNILIVLNEEYLTEFVFVFIDSIKLENYTNIIISKGFDNIQKELLMKDNISDLLDDQKKIVGKAYDIISINKFKEIKIKENVLNLIKIYMFNKDFISKTILSLNKQNKSKMNIFNDECYLINREYLEKYKDYYLYQDIQKYLDSLNNNYISRIEEIFERIQKENFYKNIKDKEPLLISDINIKPKEKKINNEISYLDDFIIVNKDIYNKLTNNINIIEDNLSIQYIINSGKIFLLIRSEEKNTYQIIIGEIKTFNIHFYPKVLLVMNSLSEFNAFETDLMVLYYPNYFKYFAIKKEDDNNNKLIINQTKAETGFIFDINDNNDIFKEFALEEEEEKMDIMINNEIKLMIEIFMNYEKIKKGINEQENYYILNFDFIKYLNQFYNYDLIISNFNGNENFKKYLEESLLSDKIIINEELIANIIKGNNNINILINAYEQKNLNLDIQKNLEIENKIQKLNNNENNQKFFLNNFTIINENMKEALKIIFNIQSEDIYFKQVKCLNINKNFVYIFYLLNDIYLVNIGNFRKNDFIYENKILLEINTKEYFDELFNKNAPINENINKIIDILLNDNDQLSMKIEDINKNEKGIAYLIQKNEVKKKENIIEQNLNTSLTKFILSNAFNKKEKNKTNKINFSPILIGDIKIIIKYILFQKKIKEAIDCSKIENFYKYFQNCYLTNFFMWSKFKSYIYYQPLIDIIQEETKNLRPVNNKKSSDYDDVLINKICSSLINKCSTNQELYNQDQINNVLKNLEEQKKFNIIFNNSFYNEKLITYPSDFEIVDESIYEDLKQRFKNNSEGLFLKSDIIINKEKMIIKCEKIQREQSTNSLILIGNLDINCIFFSKYSINFLDEKNKQEFFESFLKADFETNIKKFNNYFIEYNISQKIKFIQFDDNVMNFDEKHIGDKMIKLFLFLYLFHDEINATMKASIKDNERRFYYLINKQWLKLYTEHYDYGKLYSFFENMKKKQLFKYNYRQLVEYMKQKDYDKSNEFICQIINEIPKDRLKKMEDKKKEQEHLIKKLKEKSYNVNKNSYKFDKVKNLSYYSENELISCELFSLFEQLETKQIKDLLKAQSEKISCLIGENKLFIISENETKNNQPKIYILNVGNIQENIFNPNLLIISYEKKIIEKIILQINNNSFSEFIQSYNLIDNPSCPIYNSEPKKVIGKICRIASLSNDIKLIIENANIINSESMKLLELILFFKIFIKRAKAPLKENKEYKGYFVGIDFITEIIKLPGYKIIDDYITKNNEIQEILNTNKNKSIEDLSKNVQTRFDMNTIKEINKDKNSIKVNSSTYKVTWDFLNLNKNTSVQYKDKFVILNKEIYNLFKKWVFMDNHLGEYYPGDDKIFLKIDSQKIILIYNISDKAELNLELILHLDKNINDVFSSLKENGFNNFINYLVFDNDTISPIFNSNQKKIGTAFKYIPQQKDYNDYNICFEMKKIISLYLNYKKFNSQKKFSEYYIVNKQWIQNYKNYYDFDLIYKEIEKIPIITNIINSLKEKEEISEKKLALILKKIPKNIIDKFLEKDNNFTKKYQNNETKTPQLFAMEYIDNSQQTKSFFFYNDFEIINSKLYKNLFENIDIIFNFEKNFFGKKRGIENKAEKVLCLFDKNRIIIKLNNNLSEDNKYVLYIGHINSTLSFEIECFLFYNSNSLMEEHIQKITNSIGFNDFCEEFINSPINVKELEIDNKKYGIAVKKLQNSNWDFKYDDNDSIVKYFKFAPKVGLANIGATCYMNATLQCFCQIEEFASYFKYHSHVKEVSQSFQNNSQECLTESFKILIEEIWPQKAMNEDSSQRFYEPHEFRQRIAKMNPLFQNVEANDAKDLVNFIIMTLHEELNEPIQNNNSLVINNQQDPQEVFRVFYEEYQYNFRSKISELFYGIQQTQTQCLICQKVLYNFQAYFFLVFPLEEVKKFSMNKINQMKNNNQNFMNNMNNFGMNNNMINTFNNSGNNNFFSNNGMNNNIGMNDFNMNNMMNTMNNMMINNDNFGMMNINNMNMGNFVASSNMNNIIMPNMNNDVLLNQKYQKLSNNIVDIIDCFEYNQKTEHFKGNDQIYCNQCNKMADAYYTSILETPPKILILLLNRGAGIQFKIKLEFTTELDITNYIQRKTGNIKYKLIGVITHLGESGEGGHFIAHCLSPIDNEWYTYNDAIVSKIDEFKKQIIDLGMPYLLFYKLIE